MAFPHRAKLFYLRSCYGTYYDLVLDQLDNKGKMFITITGSPGIGKSVFYLYFVPRYRRERGGIIVSASFTDDRVLSECKVYYPDKTDPIRHTMIPCIENAMYIYDGTPSMKPPGDQRMICFTSPHRGWSKFIRKENAHIELHMPVWTETELYEANDALSLNLEREEIRRRFNVFGGVARACLLSDPHTVDSLTRSLFKRVSALDSRDVETFLQRKVESCDDYHCIFHYHPLDDDVSRYTIGICSPEIEKRIIGKICDDAATSRF